jgi:hypothetical protein
MLFQQSHPVEIRRPMVKRCADFDNYQWLFSPSLTCKEERSSKVNQLEQKTTEETETVVSNSLSVVSEVQGRIPDAQ